MKFGVFIIFQSADRAVGPPQRYAECLALAQLADRLGFDTAWLAEHHFSNFGFVPSPLPIAVKIACQTERIRVGTAVIVAGLHHPIRLAEDIATVDLLTNGRLNVGIGRGYQQYEFDGYGIPLESSREMLEEWLDVLRAAWGPGEIQHQGRHFQMRRPVTVYPKPVQQPHPPIWLACTSPESIDFAGRHGFRAIGPSVAWDAATVPAMRRRYEEALRAGGHPTEGLTFGCQRFVHVAPTQARAEEALPETRWVGRLAGRYHHDQQIFRDGYAVPEPYEGEPSDAEWNARIIYGTPDQVVERIRDLQSAGVTYVNCALDFGGLSPDRVRQSMELFATEVMPAFTEAPAPAG